MLNRNGTSNGFSFDILKNGQTTTGEIVEGKLIRRVQLPQSYYTNLNEIFKEVALATQKANSSQKEAFKIKKQYMNAVCKDSIRVTFIDNTEYKAICNEGKYYAQMKEKIDNKFEEINMKKKQAREQLNQQKIIDAQVIQANAAARSAAAEEFNNIQSLANLNNQMQNTTQMIQQNNSYSSPSITPFTGFNNSNDRKVRNCWIASGIEFCN